MSIQDAARPSTSTQISPGDLLHHLIQQILASVAAADMACVCRYRHDLDEMETLSYQLASPQVTYPTGDARTLLKDLMKQMPVTGDPVFFEKAALRGTGFQSALVFPLSLPDEVIGVMGLFSRRPQAFSLHDAEAIITQVNITRAIVENLYLYEELARYMVITQSITLTAQMVAEIPSPQQVVDVLCEYLFDAHVSSCAILLYGPVREDRPYGPFDYLEISGSWSRRWGSGIGVTTKIYLKDYPNILQELEAGRPLVIDNVQKFRRGLDSYVRSLVTLERIVSMTLLPLNAGQRRLGILLVGTNKRRSFSSAEVKSYQTVSEFLAISAMSQFLQQQHDVVQQGRSALLEAVQDGVVMVLPDMAGARVLTVNKRFTSFFGLPTHKAEGMLLGDLLEQMQIPEGVRRELRPLWLNVHVQDTLEQRGTFAMVHHSGAPMDIEWRSAPVFQGNHPHPLGRIYTFHDVTSERAAERLRSAVLGNVSHELATPLQAIQGYAELILDIYGEQLPARSRDYTQLIFNSAKHLSNVFDAMLDMARADVGELKLNMRESHLPDVIIDAVAQLELRFKEREQSVIMELDDELPPVHIDNHRIMQVLTNLIKNAIKYSPAGGRIFVSASYIPGQHALPTSAPPDAPLPAILVSVIDEGPGLPPEDVAQVFMPLFRAKDARARQIEGAGLGLAIARSFVSLHRGYIWAEPATEENPGGRFMFVLPTIPRQN